MTEEFKQGDTLFYCTGCFRSRISNVVSVDLDMVWDIEHRSTNINCIVEDCPNNATWVINGKHNLIGMLKLYRLLKYYKEHPAAMNYAQFKEWIDNIFMEARI